VLAKLIITEHGKEPRTLEFKEPRQIIIGRSIQADIVLPDPELSRSHCQIDIGKISSKIRDLGSKNGIYINNIKIESSELVDGTEILLGTTKIVFQSPAAIVANMATVPSAEPVVPSPHGATTHIKEQPSPRPQAPFAGEPEAYCKDCKTPVSYGMIARRQVVRTADGAYLCPACHEKALSSSVAEICFGKFRVEEKFADEATGAVYRAVDQTTEQAVALKVIELPPDVSKSDMPERLLKKAETAAKLQHANIIPLLEAEVVDARILCAMELVEGQNALKKIKSRGRMQIREAVKIGLQLVGALQYASDNGVTQCDVSPGNIFICPDGSIKLACVGFASPMISAAVSGSREDKFVAALCYSAPELLEDPSISDPRIFVYSTAATLYHMVTGRPPFAAKTASECANMIKVKSPVPPISLNSHVPPLLNDIITRSMAKNPNHRYESLLAMARDLRMTMR